MFPFFKQVISYERKKTWEQVTAAIGGSMELLLLVAVK
jgi:hypothetical protein